MKKILIAIVCAIVVAVIAVSSLFEGDVVIKTADERVKDNENIIVASYNTAAPWGNVLKGTGTNKRAKLFAQQINDNLPDVIGVQEINSNWVKKMDEYLPQYDYYGVIRGGDSNEEQSEMNGIFYLKDKFELVDCNTFWISETPEVESKYKDAGCYRICSYVILKNKVTGKAFAHFNTHFDNTSEDAQELGGKLVGEKSKEIVSKYGDIPVVITGDFNQYSDAPGCVALEEKGYKSANKTVENGDNMVTYNGWTKETVGRPIDYIFVNDKFSVNSYRVVTETGAKTNVSDHYMIESNLGIK
jgi:endonuclease/exonuclease/phosphatase family metal-dependent hydrolase